MWGERVGGKSIRNGVGLELMNALPDLLHANVLACNNIRPTPAFYQFCGGRLSACPTITVWAAASYQLAKPLRYIPPGPARFRMEKWGRGRPDPAGDACHAHTPVKDTWYLRRRYFRYPYFHYDVWAARGNGKLLAYVVTRTVTAEETGCVPVVRLVDFIGEDAVLPRLGGALDAILNRAGGEYMDCCNAGIPAEVWQAAGFTERLEGDGSVIPNYLTPPLLENTEYYYFTNKPENFVLFKADGDQDRPNLK